MADFGVDRSGNNNHWTDNNLTYSDQMVDSPTNNFCTLNPLSTICTGKTLSEGNLKTSGTLINQVGGHGTHWINSSGKWYVEVVMTANAGGQPQIGLNDGTATVGARGLVFYNDGRKGTNGGYVTYGSNTSWTTGDIMGIAYNGDDNSGECTLYKNNTSLGVAYTGLNSTLGDTFTFTCQNNATGTTTFVWNFGQDSSFAGEKTAQGNQDSNDIGDFYYTPPSGFLALCTSNLPAVAVTPSEHFNTVLYTGNGSTLNVTGVGFQPDFVWLKERSGTDWHTVFDTVRGATESLYPNETDAEATYSGVTSFDSDGFTLGSHGNENTNTDTYVAWNWKANGSGSANTEGSINTTATSANVDAGFSIVTASGAGSNGTFGHGLSKAPEMLIRKTLNTTDNWGVYHIDVGNDKILGLNQTAAESTNSVWGNTTPTSDVFTMAPGSNDWVVYCFHSVDGYSKVGSYTGNADDDGTFVYTGFQPAFLLIKSAVHTESWHIWDNKRWTRDGNPNQNALVPNTSAAEVGASTPYNIDFLSNGFKLRDDHDLSNGDGDTHIYLAFAETPFKYSNAR